MHGRNALVSRNSLVHIFSSAAIGITALYPTISSPSSLEKSLAVIGASLNEKVVSVEVRKADGTLPSISLETTIFKPPGDGPFPVLIMNHGKEPEKPSQQKRDRFFWFAHEFVKRGYIVIVPMRRGFAGSGGRYDGFDCNMPSLGIREALSIEDILSYVREQSWADQNKIVIAGQSLGGLATLAFGSYDPAVSGLINFAGGLRDDSDGCNWQASLIDAMKDYGAMTSLPSLWIYGENDSLFGPDLAKRMFNAYNSAGGKAQFFAAKPFKRDSHGMLASRDGINVWLEPTLKFLTSIDMPTEPVFFVESSPELPETRFAPLDDVEAVPNLNNNGRRAYREFLTKVTPRAFAISASGQWCWAEEGEDPVARAVETCTAASNTPCKVYAVDDRVVWKDASQPVGSFGGQTHPLTEVVPGN